MPIISFDIPTNQPGRMTNAQMLNNFCSNFGFTGTFNGSPETQVAFLKRMTVNWWASNAQSAEVRVLRDAIVPTAVPDVT